MSFINDPKAPGGSRCVCDRCGGDCGNGGIDRCAIVSDLDKDHSGMVKNYHFCRKMPGEKGQDCASKLLSTPNLAWYRAQHADSTPLTAKAKSTGSRSKR